MRTMVGFPGLLLVVTLLAGCGGGGGGGGVFEPQFQVEPNPDSVFISLLRAENLNLDNMTRISYSIEPKPGAVAAAVNVEYSSAAAERKGIYDRETRTLALPVFGLYSDHENMVTVAFDFAGSRSRSVQVPIQTGIYTDFTEDLDDLQVTHAASSANPPGFSYFYLKHPRSPIIYDIDGEIRWIYPYNYNANSVFFIDNYFLAGSNLENAIYRVELDGTIDPLTVSGGGMVISDFHHDISFGKTGIFVSPNGTVDGVEKIESYILEITPEGDVLREWDLGDIFSDYLRDNGEDPANFVRDGADWLHLNSIFYDPVSDTILASSRENFVFRFDYETGELHWLFGDFNKHWYVNYPAFRPLALSLLNNGEVPIGQHSTTILDDGSMLLFNNGTNSINTPPDTPRGIGRTTSLVSKYRIDDESKTAELLWNYDGGLDSLFCSAVYQDENGNYLISHTASDLATRTVIETINEAQELLLQFNFPSMSCATKGSREADVAPLESIRFE